MDGNESEIPTSIEIEEATHGRDLSGRIDFKYVTLADFFERGNPVLSENNAGFE